MAAKAPAMPHHHDHLHNPNNPCDDLDDRSRRHSRQTPERPTQEPVPLSVWACAQQPAAFQRRGRYLPGSTAHPAKMLPAVAAAAINAYTQPDDIVLDPMCGIGTTLVEAAHHGRTPIG